MWPSVATRGASGRGEVSQHGQDMSSAVARAVHSAACGIGLGDLGLEAEQSALSWRALAALCLQSAARANSVKDATAMARKSLAYRSQNWTGTPTAKCPRRISRTKPGSTSTSAIAVSPENQRHLLQRRRLNLAGRGNP
jgi:hypothetical protein